MIYDNEGKNSDCLPLLLALAFFDRGRELNKMHDFLCQELPKTSSAVSGRVEVNTCLVLQYHRVASLCFDPLQLAVEPYNFERQIEYLAENFNVISIDELKSHLDTSRPFEERTVVITFDGGYCDVLYTAKDVLDRFGVSAAVFASSSNIIEGGRFWWQELENFIIANNCRGQLELEIDCQLRRWPLLTQFDKCRAYEDLYSILSNKIPSEQRIIVEEISRSLELHAEELDDHRTMSGQELRKLTEGGLITVGGHTHNFVKLSSVPVHRRIVEVLKNKEILGEVLGGTVEYFSYPFDSDDTLAAETVGILKDVGYSLACGNSYGTAGIAGETSRYDLPRVKVGNWNTFVFYKFLRRFFD